MRARSEARSTLGASPCLGVSEEKSRFQHFCAPANAPRPRSRFARDACEWQKDQSRVGCVARGPGSEAAFAVLSLHTSTPGGRACQERISLGCEYRATMQSSRSSSTLRVGFSSNGPALPPYGIDEKDPSKDRTISDRCCLLTSSGLTLIHASKRTGCLL